MTTAKWFLATALTILGAGIVFTGITTLIWPDHQPTWVLRTSSAGLLAGILLTLIGAGLWLRRR